MTVVSATLLSKRQRVACAETEDSSDSSETSGGDGEDESESSSGSESEESVEERPKQKKSECSISTNSLTTVTSHRSGCDREETSGSGEEAGKERDKAGEEDYRLAARP